MTKPLELHPRLHGVDHTARPTWKLRETVHFYRDILGLPLVHCISAKGWGREKENHADILHFFFDSGNESTIAFFYYIGTQQPPELVGAQWDVDGAWPLPAGIAGSSTGSVLHVKMPWLPASW